MKLSITRLSAIAGTIRRLLFGGASLDLNFTAPSQQLDPRITFTRASNATVTGPTGVLGYAPHNLLTFSEQFDNAAWEKGASTTITANAGAAPNGSTTADRAQMNSPSGTFVRQVANTIAGLTYVFSTYVRSVSGSGFVTIQLGTASQEFPTTESWSRVSISFTATGSTLTSAIDDGGRVFDAFLWGAQLNIGPLQPYYPTTVKNLLGYTQEFDNAAWTKSNAFVQTNQIRNNTMVGAVAGTPGTTPNNWGTFTSLTGLTRQVVGAGIESGISYVDLRVSGTPSAAGLFGVYFDTATGIPALNGQTWTASQYARIVAGSLAGITQINNTISENSAGGGYLAGSSAPFTPTTEMVRRSFTRTFTNASAAFVMSYYDLLLTGAAIDITLRIGLPQLVQGSTPGDVVATYGTAKAVQYAAPDGSLTADKLVASGGSVDHLIDQISASFPTGTLITESVYAKASECSEIRVRIANAGAFSGAPQAVTFVLSGNGSGSVAQGSPAFSILSVGNGWYRCSIAAAAVATGGVTVRLSPSISDTTSFNADGSGIYIWGAQLSDSASLDPYVYNPEAAPTAQAYYGPRFDYDPVTLAPKGLLIEEQRTNFLLYSEQIDNAYWGKNNLTVASNSAIAPDGALTGDTIIANTSNAEHNTDSGSVSITSGITYTFTAYVKAAGLTTLGLRFTVGSLWPGGASPQVAFDLINLTVATVGGAPASSSITNAGNGWYRIQMSVAAISTGSASARFQLMSGLSNVFTGDGTSGIYIWGAQLEAGAFPTSYIPTTTAAATRAADVAVMTGANFSNWYRQDEGTFFADAIASVGSSGVAFVGTASDGTINNFIDVARYQPTLRALVRASGLAPNIAQAVLSANAYHKTAFTYEANQSAISADGGATITAALTGIPVVNRLDIGHDGSLSARQLNGHIRRLAFFPRRLSNSELEGITK